MKRLISGTHNGIFARQVPNQINTPRPHSQPHLNERKAPNDQRRTTEQTYRHERTEKSRNGKTRDAGKNVN